MIQKERILLIEILKDFDTFFSKFKVFLEELSKEF